MSIIPRVAEAKIKQLAGQFKAVAVIGPRQSGKTTLVRACFPGKPYVSLENPESRQFATDDPRGFLNRYPSGAIFDEVQRVPDLLSWLQQDLDESNEKGKFVLTGSNNFLLVEKITQTLAGRVAYIDLLPFCLAEVEQIPDGQLEIDTLLHTGTYPSVLVDRISPQDWFSSYVRTYVERDVRQIKSVENLLAFEKLLALCAGRIGQLVNYSNLAVEIGVDYKTIQSWLGILQASYIVHFLPPYHKNFNKRVVKSPKLYFYDTGLACFLLRIADAASVAQHAGRGALFENFVVNELIKQRFNAGQRSNLYFWRDSGGHEIDILIDAGHGLTPLEVKSGQTVTADYFRGLQYWKMLTDTAGGVVIYGGDDSQDRSDGSRVRSWRSLSGLNP